MRAWGQLWFILELKSWRQERLRGQHLGVSVFNFCVCWPLHTPVPANFSWKKRCFLRPKQDARSAPAVLSRMTLNEAIDWATVPSAGMRHSSVPSMAFASLVRKGSSLPVGPRSVGSPLLSLLLPVLRCLWKLSSPTWVQQTPFPLPPQQCPFMHVLPTWPNQPSISVSMESQSHKGAEASVKFAVEIAFWGWGR